MDRFAALTAFVRVVELGSFARAAERLETSTSSISRQVAELEAHLGTRLLNRTTRRLSLTEAGRDFQARCAAILEDLDEAESAASRSGALPVGTLRMTCAINFGVRHLAPAVAEFAQRHPQVSFDLSLSDRFVDLVEEGFDLAVRIGESSAGSLVARRLGETRLVPCAAPDYLARHGEPDAPADLANHRCLTYEYLAARDLWRFRDRGGAMHDVRVAGRVNANNGDLLVALAIQGLGIVLEPDFVVDEALRAGRLVRLLPDYAAPEAAIYAMYPSRRQLSSKVRAFVDFLAERFAAGLAGIAPP